MKINYISTANEWTGSYRYQILTPAIGLKKLGHEVMISKEPVPDYDVYLFHKHFHPEAEQQMVRDIKKYPNNPRTVFIISDSHFNDRHREHYMTMITSVDLVVAITHELARHIKEHTGVDAVVIFDPWGVEFEEHEPAYSPNGKLKALWFGHKSNLPGLMKELPKLKDIDIDIVCSPDITGGRVGDVEFRTIPYTIPVMKEGFRKCDIVLIPQKIHKSVEKLAKTHNRIVDSFRAGKFVVASPVDSYLDFKEWAYIGDIREGIDWLKEQPKEDIVRRIGEAQKFIRTTFNPEGITKQWEQALEKR